MNSILWEIGKRNPSRIRRKCFVEAPKKWKKWKCIDGVNNPPRGQTLVVNKFKVYAVMKSG